MMEIETLAMNFDQQSFSQRVQQVVAATRKVDKAADSDRRKLYAALEISGGDGQKLALYAAQAMEDKGAIAQLCADGNRAVRSTALVFAAHIADDAQVLNVFSKANQIDRKLLIKHVHRRKRHCLVDRLIEQFDEESRESSRQQVVLRYGSAEALAHMWAIAPPTAAADWAALALRQPAFIVEQLERELQLWGKVVAGTLATSEVSRLLERLEKQFPTWTHTARKNFTHKEGQRAAVALLAACIKPLQRIGYSRQALALYQSLPVQLRGTVSCWPLCASHPREMAAELLQPVFEALPTILAATREDEQQLPVVAMRQQLDQQCLHYLCKKSNKLTTEQQALLYLTAGPDAVRRLCRTAGSKQASVLVHTAHQMTQRQVAAFERACYAGNSAPSLMQGAVRLINQLTHNLAECEKVAVEFADKPTQQCILQRQQHAQLSEFPCRRSCNQLGAILQQPFSILPANLLQYLTEDTRTHQLRHLLQHHTFQAATAADRMLKLNAVRPYMPMLPWAELMTVLGEALGNKEYEVRCAALALAVQHVRMYPQSWLCVLPLLQRHKGERCEVHQAILNHLCDVVEYIPAGKLEGLQVYLDALMEARDRTWVIFQKCSTLLLHLLPRAPEWVASVLVRCLLADKAYLISTDPDAVPSIAPVQESNAASYMDSVLHISSAVLEQQEVVGQGLPWLQCFVQAAWRQQTLPALRRELKGRLVEQLQKQACHWFGVLSQRQPTEGSENSTAARLACATLQLLHAVSPRCCLAELRSALDEWNAFSLMQLLKHHATLLQVLLQELLRNRQHQIMQVQEQLLQQILSIEAGTTNSNDAADIIDRLAEHAVGLAVDSRHTDKWTVRHQAASCRLAAYILQQHSSTLLRDEYVKLVTHVATLPCCPTGTIMALAHNAALPHAMRSVVAQSMHRLQDEQQALQMLLDALEVPDLYRAALEAIQNLLGAMAPDQLLQLMEPWLSGRVGRAKVAIQMLAPNCTTHKPTLDALIALSQLAELHPSLVTLLLQTFGKHQLENEAVWPLFLLNALCGRELAMETMVDPTFYVGSNKLSQLSLACQRHLHSLYLTLLDHEDPAVRVAAARRWSSVARYAIDHDLVMVRKLVDGCFAHEASTTLQLVVQYKRQQKNDE